MILDAHFDINDCVIERAKVCLADGPLHECMRLGVRHVFYATDAHDAWLSEHVVDLLVAKRLATVEGETPNRIVRLTS